TATATTQPTTQPTAQATAQPTMAPTLAPEQAAINKLTAIDESNAFQLTPSLKFDFGTKPLLVYDHRGETGFPGCSTENMVIDQINFFFDFHQPVRLKSIRWQAIVDALGSFDAPNSSGWGPDFYNVAMFTRFESGTIRNMGAILNQSLLYGSMWQGAYQDWF